MSIDPHQLDTQQTSSAEKPSAEKPGAEKPGAETTSGATAPPAVNLQGRLAWTAKRTYAGVAHGAGKVLTRVGILPAEPPDPDRRLQHWLTSLTRVHDSLAIADLGVPWWTYRAIDVIDAWLLARPAPIRAFEYGSGASTFWLADRADEVISIEHHRGFSEVIGPALATRPNVDLRVVEAVASTNPVIGSAKPGNQGLDFSAYVHAIDDATGLFDVIVVDGRAREACLAISTDRLAPGGVIVYDNSHRKRYRLAIRHSRLHERRLPGLTPTLPYPDQTSLLFAEPTRPDAPVVYPDGRAKARE